MALSLQGLLGRPLLIEGQAGVGKTEIAKVLAAVHGRRLIRLQCYEGLDAKSRALRVELPAPAPAIRPRGPSAKTPTRASGRSSRSPTCSSARCSQAIRPRTPVVLLIDEVDRADEEFEAFLLELLSDFQVTIPELGTVAPRSIPHVVLTSNGTRELSDALRRRCLYL